MRTIMSGVSWLVIGLFALPASPVLLATYSLGPDHWLTRVLFVVELPFVVPIGLAWVMLGRAEWPQRRLKGAAR